MSLFSMFSSSSDDGLDDVKSDALDLVRTNVMAADKDLNIIYMNPAIQQMMREVESDLRKDLPHFDANRLIGQNIDVFHKDPSHQRRLLGNLKTTFETMLLVGGRIFNLVITPLLDDGGDTKGFVVEWQFADEQAKVSSLEKSQAMIEFQMDGTIINANQNFLDVMGYRLDEIQGKHHSLFVDREYVKSDAYLDFWRRLNSGETFSEEFRRIRKDGETVWLQASYNPILNNHGKPVRVVKYAADITDIVKERRKAETLSLVADNTDNSVIITDAQERIEYVNPGFERVTGYRLDEVKGKKPGEFLQGKQTDTRTRKAIREKIDARKPFYDEILNYAKDGTPYWISLSINPIFGEDGNVERFISVQANITAAKEKSIRNKRCIDAIEQAQGSIELDMKGHIIASNENFQTMSGYTASDLDGKNIRSLMDPDYVKTQEYQEMWAAVERGDYQTGEYPMRSREGKELWINGSFTAITDAFDEPISILCYATDMTEKITTRRENEQGAKECMDVLRSLSRGDLTRKMHGEYEGDFSAIRDSLNDMVDKLVSIVQQVKESSEAVHSASEEISSGSLDLSSRTEEQASSLEETAASMEQITSTVRQNSDNATQASQLSDNARNVAENGGQVVGETIEAMNSIEDSSQKISDIIGVIDEIAFQTNLLALNAAVEAARAGEAGKGFAVVASEVRALAGRSASASKEIKTLIQESGHKVRSGVELVDKAGNTLKDIVEAVRDVNTLVTDIATASKEQASGIDEVSSAVSQMDEMTQQNAAMVEENTAAAQSLQEQAQQLGELMAFFSIGEEEQAESSAKPATHKPKVAATRANTNGNGGGNGHGQAHSAKKAAAKPHVNGKAEHAAIAHKQQVQQPGGHYDVGWEEF